MVEKDYYKILGVSHSASEEEIKKAYFRLAKKYHPDRHRGESGGDYEIKFTLINEAYNVLKDRTVKEEYDKRIGPSGRMHKGPSSVSFHAEELYNTALKAISMNDVNTAIDLMKEAIRIEPDKAAYYSTLGKALSRKPRRLHEAREMCEKAVEMEPYDVENYINLGLVYKKAGLNARSRKQFESALRLEHDHPVAKKELGQSDSRRWLARIQGFMKKLFLNEE